LERLERNSPFTPGKPVPIEFFTGRKNEINRIKRSLSQTAKGKNENLFLTGDRGLGKSSLASYSLDIAEIEHDLLPVYCPLGGITSVSNFVKTVIEKMVASSRQKEIHEAFKQIFRKYISDLGLGIPGIFSVKLDIPKEELDSFPSNFLPILNKSIETLKKHGKKGIALVLDDLNGITAIPEFAHFLKSTVDSIQIEYKGLPLFLMLSGTKERRLELIEKQPSVGRIFDVIELGRLDEEEVKSFFLKSFESVSIKIEDDALSYIAKKTNGYPIFMQEIGDSVFWSVPGNLADYENAIEGVFDASVNIGHKYLDSQVYETIKSEKYHSILNKIGKAIAENRIETEFHKNELKKALGLSEKETDVLDNFLGKMKELNVIVPILEKKGYRRFSNDLYSIYIRLQSVEPKSRR
jgi:hypothetical protein